MDDETTIPGPFTDLSHRWCRNCEDTWRLPDGGVRTRLARLRLTAATLGWRPEHELDGLERESFPRPVTVCLPKPACRPCPEETE